MTAIHHQTNHAAFAKLLPGLMQKHEGKFAVMDTGHLVGLFKSEALPSGAVTVVLTTAFPFCGCADLLLLER
jgi:hypothetical protein